MMEVLILVLIAVAVFCALRYIKKHKPTCSGGCAGCTVDCKYRK